MAQKGYLSHANCKCRYFTCSRLSPTPVRFQEPPLYRHQEKCFPKNISKIEHTLWHLRKINPIIGGTSHLVVSLRNFWPWTPIKTKGSAAAFSSTSNLEQVSTSTSKIRINHTQRPSTRQNNNNKELDSFLSLTG